MTIAEAKRLPTTTQVTVEGVTTFVEPDECYIEDSDRSAGVWVLGPTKLLPVGGQVTVHGTFDRMMGEPAITDAAIFAQGTQADTRPFGMQNRSLGGEALASPWIRDFILKPTPTWKPACGANNVGLLVTTWGTVRSVYRSPAGLIEWLYLEDNRNWYPTNRCWITPGQTLGPISPIVDLHIYPYSRFTYGGRQVCQFSITGTPSRRP